ncbi:hypothetical protein [Pyrobaculum aerophilum]|uniref:Uncharacterized protein n=1 Tax=Pyrobaculum aerophilum TaxID=13773 RepID=A0A371QYN5_9CREN|nr:hypothetical protein [Pyrobaculum aerophilum]RFA95815.1 hypothetical protein CGL52_12190 [Pyrobaculum aerophilum]RFA96170.1 hypothetical protein CGL51_05755 [Pyrobaculum aerophilum]
MSVIRYSPAGEYIRLVILKRLAKGPATVEELDALAKRAVEALGVRYDWRVWPVLLKREIVIEGDVARLTPYGEVLVREALGEVEEWLGKVFPQLKGAET